MNLYIQKTSLTIRSDLNFPYDLYHFPDFLISLNVTFYSWVSLHFYLPDSKWQSRLCACVCVLMKCCLIDKAERIWFPLSQRAQCNFGFFDEYANIRTRAIRTDLVTWLYWYYVTQFFRHHRIKFPKWAPIFRNWWFRTELCVCPLFCCFIGMEIMRHKFRQEWIYLFRLRLGKLWSKIWIMICFSHLYIR